MPEFPAIKMNYNPQGRHLWACVIMLCTGALGSAYAQDGERALLVERISAPVSTQAPVLDLQLDRSSQVYQLGEHATVTVKSQVDGFLYVLYVHSDDSVHRLFPNSFESANKVTRGGTYKIPGDGAMFRLTASPPLGTGVVKAFILNQSLALLGVKEGDDLLLELDDKKLAALETELQTKGVGVRPRTSKPAVGINEEAPQILADRRIRMETVAAGQFKGAEDRRARAKQRFVVSIGVGEQKKSTQYKSIPECSNDARQFGGLMKERYGAITTFLLDKDVTALRVRETLATVAKQTQPGDEVILFWSGHGDFTLDTSGDEKDGVDEILVPWDGDQDDIAGTMILDDMLGRWVQDFVGCELLVILDACNSGGQARNEKGISWEGEFNRFTKDITEQQATVLCSSSRIQKSFAGTENHLSVMTHFIFEYLQQNAQQKVTVSNVFDYLKQKVPEYTKKRFNFEQTPVLIGNVKSKIVFGD